MDHEHHHRSLLLWILIALAAIGLAVALGTMQSVMYQTEAISRAIVQQHNTISALQNGDDTQADTDTEKGDIYTNEHYGFSLTFPASWGDVIARSGSAGDEQVLRQMVDTIGLQAAQDDERYIYIMVTEATDEADMLISDAPRTELGRTEHAVIYAAGKTAPLNCYNQTTAPHTDTAEQICTRLRSIEQEITEQILPSFTLHST